MKYIVGFALAVSVLLNVYLLGSLRTFTVSVEYRDSTEPVTLTVTSYREPEMDAHIFYFDSSHTRYADFFFEGADHYAVTSKSVFK